MDIIVALMRKGTEHSYPGGSDCFRGYTARPSAVCHHSAIQVYSAHREETADKPTVQHLPSPPSVKPEIKALTAAGTILHYINPSKNNSTY